MAIPISKVVVMTLAATSALASGGGVERISVPAAGEFAMEMEARFEAAGSAVHIDAGAQLEASADASDSAIRIRILSAGKAIVDEIERLKPEVRKGWGEGVEEDLAREAASMTGWRGRAFRLKVDAAGDEVWFWFDGRAIARFPREALPARITVRTTGNASLQQIAGAEPSRRGALQMVDLNGYSNTGGAAVSGAFTVHGIPFYATRRAVDLSETGLRIRRKTGSPNSLWDNPFNFNSAMDGDPLTSIIRVPKRYYRRAWLLCGAPGAGLSSKATVRLARYRGEAGVFFADSEFAVPGPNGVPVAIPGMTGQFWLVPVPLDPGAMQDNLAADVLRAQGNRSEVLKLDADVPWMEIELTRELRADLTCMLPLGPKSGVRVYGMTLEESPVRMVVTTDATGSLFEPGVHPRYNVWVENNTAKPQRSILTTVTLSRERQQTRKKVAIALAAAEKRMEHVELPALGPGKYDLTFQLRDLRGTALVRRQTTLAVLPPDTRKAERDSPFGLWSWGGAHLTPPNEVEAELMRRAGARFTLGVGYRSKHQYGIGTGTDDVIGVFYPSKTVPPDSPEAPKEMLAAMKSRGSNPLYWQMYWEDTLSRRHEHRYPPALIGRAPMALDAAELARFESYRDRAEAYAREVRRELPQAKLALGSFLNFMEEFLQRGFPKQYLDALALEITCFRMHPERPPADNNMNGLYLIEQLKKKYGYEALDTILVESQFHGTAPGYLSERDQANYYVRDFLLGLAYGVKLFGMSAMVTDVSDNYYRSAWGSVGLCHRAPEPSPKESYVAYATMTSVLDQAKYAGYVETGSTSVYALHFVRPAGDNVYAMWTVRGARPVTVTLDSPAGAEVIDAMYRRMPLKGARLELSEAPVYLVTKARLKELRMGAPRYREAPPPGAEALAALKSLDGWQPVEERDARLEDNNPSYPRRPGRFRFSAVADSTRGPAVEVSATPLDSNALLPMYGVLKRDRPLRIPGQPRRLGLWVKGNSSWGRITFELVDAKGKTWLGVGGREDTYGRGFINFDGWRWVEVDLPGQYRPDYPWQQVFDGWTPLGGDRQVDYPLSLKSIVIELRDQMVYVNRLVPVRQAAIRLEDLRVVY